jgi:predicted amidohydrolase
MKIAAFQFHSSQDLEANYAALQRGFEKAANDHVRFFITQECALCGYPPVERDTISTIDFALVSEMIGRIKKFSAASNMIVAVGTISKKGQAYRNSIILLTPGKRNLPSYDKRALWGWDVQNFSAGVSKGIYTIDGIKIGIRICFEVRFPEYFRELFAADVQIAFVSFCDVSDQENLDRYEIIKSHLITRAVENAMMVVSANSISKVQTAPTCMVDPDGKIIQIAPRDEEYLLVHDYEDFDPNYGRDGRIKMTRQFIGGK